MNHVTYLLMSFPEERNLIYVWISSQENFQLMYMQPSGMVRLTTTKRIWKCLWALNNLFTCLTRQYQSFSSCLMRSLPVSSLSSWCHDQGQCHSLLKLSTLLDQTPSLLHKWSRWRGRDRESNPFIHTEMKFKPLLFYTMERPLMWIHSLLIFKSPSSLVF